MLDYEGVHEDRSNEFYVELEKFATKFKEEAVPCSLSDCRSKFNSILKKAGLQEAVDNRSLKGLLIDQLGDDISFAYPKDRKKSQVIIPISIKPDIVNPVVLCAERI